MWWLIIMAIHANEGAPTLDKIEFRSQELCMTAAKQVQEDLKGHYRVQITATCIKGA